MSLQRYKKKQISTISNPKKRRVNPKICHKTYKSANNHPDQQRHTPIDESSDSAFLKRIVPPCSSSSCSSNLT